MATVKQLEAAEQSKARKVEKAHEALARAKQALEEARREHKEAKDAHAVARKAEKGAGSGTTASKGTRGKKAATRQAPEDAEE
jgi:hypothetical protein